MCKYTKCTVVEGFLTQNKFNTFFIYVEDSSFNISWVFFDMYKTLSPYFSSFIISHAILSI